MSKLQMTIIIIVEIQMSLVLHNWSK